MRPALLLLAACAAAPRRPPQCAAAEDIDLPTQDGATVHLHHHPAEGPPVLVVHGLSSNHWCWDLTATRSLAVALNAAGYDAWLLDLRGHGDAERRQPRGWSVDTYGQQDLSAAIDYIRRWTGYSKIGYVGHSMGGMVAAIYQQAWGDDALSAVVIVGSPVEFTDLDPLLTRSEDGFAVGAHLPTIHADAVSKAASPLGKRQPLHVDDVLFSSENLSARARQLMYRRVVSPLYPGELRQFSRILEEGRFVSADGSVDYTAALADLDVPLLVISGRVDRVAPPDRVYPYYQAAGSAEKRYVLAGRANGFAVDYGHLDLPLGDHAADEIYPLITGWFAGRWEAP